MTPKLHRRGLLAAGSALALAGPARADGGLNAVFERAFEDELDLDPTLRSVRGLPGDQSRWLLADAAWSGEAAALARRNLAEAARQKPAGDQEALSLALFRHTQEAALKRHAWRIQLYPFHQSSAPPLHAASFLISYHRIADLGGAEDYLTRLETAPVFMRFQAEEMRRRVQAGAAPPTFNFPAMISAVRAFPRGAPFDDGPDHPVLADFKTKLAASAVLEAQRAALVRRASQALKAWSPACEAFADDMTTLAPKVTRSEGAWALPDGEAFYRYCVEDQTSLALDPDDLHDFGLREVSRLQGEIAAVARELRFDGTLAAFLALLRDDPRFFEPATPEGRQRLLARFRAIIAEMEARLPELFGRLPKARVVVRPVEPFAEATSGRAFYIESSPDGARPGTFWINLSRPEANPVHQLQAVAYHEAVPGHHLQAALAAELEGLPRFRRYLTHNAFGEGWGLYAEGLPEEIGLYPDPYARAGRLSMELFRAVRVVVDTGIHRKRWSLQSAAAYMDANLANAASDNRVEVERYFNWPGQALGYQVGLDHIRKLRRRAEATLGGRFDRRGFHDAVIGEGSLTLPLLSARIDRFIAGQGRLAA